MLFNSKDLFEVRSVFFEGNKDIPFDLFIKVADRYIKIVDSDQSLVTNLWEKIKEDNITNLFIKTTDRIEFIKIGLTQNKLTAKTEDNISSLVETTRQIFNDLEKNGITQENCRFLKIAANEMIDIMKKEESLKLFLSQIRSNSLLFSHSLLRTVFCIAAAKRLFWTSDMYLSKIAFASLICDLTLKDNFNLISKDHQ